MGLLRRSGERKPLTAKRVKRMIGIGTAVAPLVAPYALAAAGVVRGRWDAYRAARLGVPADQLAAFVGPGGSLHARLSRAAATLTELEAPAKDPFVADTQRRLTELSLAVRAAEQMPASRRRTAYRAIGDELDQIEEALLARLGIRTQP